MNHLRKHNFGLSLVEVMVALTISALILAGVVQIFSSSEQADRLSTSLARIQENGRFSLDILNREFRLVGYQGCTDPNKELIPDSNILASGFAINDLSNSYVQGVDSAGGNESLYSGAITISNVVANTDVISLTFASPFFEELEADMANSSSVINIGTNNPNVSVSPNDVLLISQCESAESTFIFKVTNVDDSDTANVTLSHDASGNSTADFNGTIFQQGDKLYRISNNTYFVRQNPRGIRSLYRQVMGGSVEEMIEGIENFQVLYGHYDDNETPITSDDQIMWLTATQIDADPADDLKWQNVVTIKAAVMVSDDIEVLPENGPATFAMLGTNVAPPATDKRLRKVFTTTAKVRNKDGKSVAQ